MKIRALAAASVLVVLGSLLAGAAPARAEVAWTEGDDLFDVELTDIDGGLTVKQRRSIDLSFVRAFTSLRGTTFKVKIRSVRPAADFDQMFFIDARPVPRRGTYPLFSAGWSPQQPDQGYASKQTDDDTFVTCDLPAPVVQPGESTFTQLVPRRCLPTGPMRVTVRTAAGVFRSEGSFAEDSDKFTRSLR